MTTGAFLNALGILLGALFGLVLDKPLSVRTQDFFRRALGSATIFFGLRLVWLNVNGIFLSCAKQVFLALLALVLGNLIGKLLSLQKFQTASDELQEIWLQTCKQIRRPNSPMVLMPVQSCFAPRRLVCLVR
ncbi:MAG TPA: DUF554 family protein [Verrucomicrobiae bacterium]|nr:DUF554 family protein [Verrucomicrobiae bacterium]